MPRTAKLTNEPLYKRAETLIVERLVSGFWPAGARLPNEFDLAGELGVSQGTVRKALSALERRGLLERTPGRGTIVVQTTEEEALYAFFRLRDARGRLVTPVPCIEILGQDRADEADMRHFGASVGNVATISRVRENAGRRFAADYSRLPAPLVPGLEAQAPLPNSLYPFLSRTYGLTIMRVDESVTATLADAALAGVLDCAAGTPLLEVSRLAYDLSGRCVERRRSHYLTEFVSYQVKLGRRGDFAAGADGN
ncbi:GntR family transcriptional regulator [Tropicimonas sp.]|uniref:GntR family transcriptional regulator n=1 Tax=Tropicimonas sp. TaxID=2067044 RepID=UPI003A83C690